MSTSARNQLKQSNFLLSDKAEQVSFFEHSYKSYKPFSRFTKKIPFNSTFDFGQTVNINLTESANYADLITNLTVMVEVPDISSVSGKFGYTNAFTHALFETIELRIDGVLIDKQSSEWMDIWSELTIKPGLQKNYDYLVKKFDATFHDNYQKGVSYLPLQFWFCQNSSSNNTKNNMVLPMTSLYNSRIELIFKVRKQEDLTINKNITGATIGTTSSIVNASLLVDYIILDETSVKELRKKDINKYYLITQVQEIEKSISANTTNINFTFEELKYNVSELIWVVISETDRAKNMYFEYSYNDADPIKTTQIKFDGIERIEELPSEYFQSVEPLAVHDNTPFSFIHCYSFALSPEDFSQPSGICNFSEIHTAEMKLTLVDSIEASTFKLFALNYNVLRIRNGAGSLLNSLSKSSRKALPKDADLQKPSTSSSSSNNNNEKSKEIDYECY
jgi:hypothetical protein